MFTAPENITNTNCEVLRFSHVPNVSMM